jgi:hypothetical protein
VSIGANFLAFLLIKGRRKFSSATHQLASFSIVTIIRSSCSGSCSSTIYTIQYLLLVEYIASIPNSCRLLTLLPSQPQGGKKAGEQKEGKTEKQVIPQNS